MSNEEKYAIALAKIANLVDELSNAPEDGVYDYCGGNVDDAYGIGCDVGWSDAARIARIALGLPIGEAEDDE